MRPACTSAKLFARVAASSSSLSAPASPSPWTRGDRSQEMSSEVMWPRLFHARCGISCQSALAVLPRAALPSLCDAELGSAKSEAAEV